jgi:hypothetical protein
MCLLYIASPRPRLSVLCLPVVVGEAVWKVDLGGPVLCVGQAQHLAHMNACNRGAVRVPDLITLREDD